MHCLKKTFCYNPSMKNDQSQKLEKPILHLRDKFEDALKNYEVSDSGKELLKDITLVALRGPSGGGRNTLINKLLNETDLYQEFVTDTTRPKRDVDGTMEQEGIDYWFRSEQEILDDIKDSKYIEAEIIHNQQVSGMSLRELERARTAGKVSILDVHFGGVNALLKAKPDSHIVFITPPNFEEWVRRFSNRGNITEQDFKNRFKTSRADYEHALSTAQMKFILNDNLDDAFNDIRRLVEEDTYSQEESDRVRNIVVTIYEKLKEEIN